jgi:hypothetical protein
MMASEKPMRRRRYCAEVTKQVLAECEAPGANAVMAHGINANVVR